MSPHEKTPFLVTQTQNSIPWWNKIISEALKGKIWGVFWFFSFSSPSSPFSFFPQTKTWSFSSVIFFKKKKEKKNDQEERHCKKKEKKRSLILKNQNFLILNLFHSPSSMDSVFRLSLSFQNHSAFQIYWNYFPFF